MNIWHLHPFIAMLTLGMSVSLTLCSLCQLYHCRLLLAAVANRKRLWRSPRFVRVDATVDDSLQCLTSRETPRILIIVPAHNEERLLGHTLDSISGIFYPPDKVSTLVIVDNCTDATVDVAAAHHTLVAVRTDLRRIGKGYALQDVMAALFKSTEYSGIVGLNSQQFDVEFDAAVFLDADTIVHPDILRAFSTRLNQGDEALQACYGVQNAFESVRTKLMTCALALAHLAKPAGREKLGLSDGLKGNGVCLSRRLLKEVPWTGESITEDIDYTLRLCEAGHRIRFVPEALVWAQMPAARAAATGQRMRWESGRYHLLLTRVPSLLRRSIMQRDKILLDRVLDLIIPPFAELAAIQVSVYAASLLVMFSTEWHWARLLCACCLVALGVQAGCLLVAMWLARIPVNIASALAYAPIYIIWKLTLTIGILVTGPVRTWRRTERRRS